MELLCTPDVQQILAVHPNDYTEHRIPALISLVRRIRDSYRCRTQIHIHAHPSIPIISKGMSPKKSHQVSNMVSYVLHLIHTNNIDPVNLYIVDIGAGQGHLTRSLNACLPSTHILALDADPAQTAGARKWLTNNNTIQHQSILVSPHSLLNTVDLWVTQSAPVLFVALHACGSLTLDILRAFIIARSSPRLWRPEAVVAVGCCYNLMDPSDFPLSPTCPVPKLPPSAFQLAAQVPTEWRDPVSRVLRPSAVLAIRKVAWRALLARALRSISLPPPTNPPENIPQPPARWSKPSPSSHNDPIPKIGRLPDSVYNSWHEFLRAAGEKLGVHIGNVERDEEAERQLEMWHVLRCMVGPVVEDVIIQDRVDWVREALRTAPEHGTHELSVEAINLFDQAMGSPRNVAIVVAGKIPQSCEEGSL